MRPSQLQYTHGHCAVVSSYLRGASQQQQQQQLLSSRCRALSRIEAGAVTAVADRTQNTENPRFVNLGSPPSCLASSRVMGAPRVKPAPRQSLIEHRTQNTHHSRLGKTRFPADVPCFSRVMGAPPGQASATAVADRIQNTEHSPQFVWVKPRFPADGVMLLSRVVREATPMAVADRTQGIPNIHRGCFVHPVFPNHRCFTLLLLVFVRPHGSSLRHGRR